MSNLWWAPREIVFTRKQVLWLLWHLPVLLMGDWPPQPTSYVEPKVQKSRSRHAPFETPVAVAAELLRRLEYIGTDGLILEAIECWGKSEEALSKYFKCPVWSIRRRYKNALGYVASGPNCRWDDKWVKRHGRPVLIKGETYLEYRTGKR